MDKGKLKKTANILLNVLLYFFLAICIFTVILTVFSKRDEDGTVELFGRQMRIVTSDSMAKCDQTDVSDFDIKSIPIHSAVFIETVPKDDAEATEWYRSLEEGDVLTFRYVYVKQITITHRITHIEEKKTGGFIIELEGDNKNSDSQLLTQRIDTSVPNSRNYVIGRVTGKSTVLGFLIHLLQSTVGMIFIVIVPCLIIIALEVIKIVGMYQGEKRKKEQLEAQERDAELSELRRRLAELEGKDSGDTGSQ